jgi:hypothetical protein
MSSRDDASQNLAADSEVLMARQNLNLADFDSVGSVEELDHSNSYAIDFDKCDLTSRPAVSKLSGVALFIPSPKCRDEQLLVNGAPQCFQPRLVLGRRRN